MANRLPLTANKELKRIEELPAGDNLDLTQSGIVNASSIEANLFYGDLVGTADVSKALTNAGNILAGIVDPARLDGTYDIDITGKARTLENAANIEGGILDVARLQGTYDIDIEGAAQKNKVVEVDTNLSYYPTFVSDSGDRVDLALNRSLSYNPSTKTLAINSNSPDLSKKLYVDGDAEFTSTVDALSYFGNGVNLTGIVTQITSGIGVRITSTQEPGKGVVNIDSYYPIGKTIFVTQNGNDNNSGLTENDSKKTIKAAASIAVSGDTIKVFPGVYVEDNPIILKKTVSIEGTELRNCVITPRYPYLDLFHVNNGCHITDVSFIGPEMTDGAAVVALQKLQGVAVDRYFDAARMIRLNLDYIAKETVGYLTSTSYQDPPFTVVNSSGISTDVVNCSDDIKDVWKCIIHDITRGGNSRCVDAGNSYYNENGELIHIGYGNSIKQATIDAIEYSFNIARAIVNNSTWGGKPEGSEINVSNASYDHITGITSITTQNPHGLSKDDSVKIVGLGFTCPSGPGIVTYPSGAFGYIFNVHSVNGNDNFEVIVGQSTLPHTYQSGGKIQKYVNYQTEYTQVKDLGIQKDPLVGFNNAISGCANVISAMKTCVGIVTNIIEYGSDAFNIVGFKTTYPGNSGIGFDSLIEVETAEYDNESGRTRIYAPGLKNIEGELIELRNFEYECGSNGGISTQRFPSGAYGYDFFIDKVNNDGTFDVYVGPSSLPHTYIGGGVIVDRTVGVTTATYNHTTGIATIRAEGLSIETGDLVKIRDLEFSCPSGPAILTYPTGNNGYEFRVLDIVVDKPVAVSTATYNNVTGIATITAPGISVQYNDIVEIKDLIFSCPDSPPNLKYPTGNNGYRFRVLNSNNSTFTVNVGVSTLPHTYVSGGYIVKRTQTANDTFTINVGVSTLPHTYVDGGIVIPPFSRGVGPITQGPYVRNCTNFISKSIGMKVDGFEAEPGDKDDIGVTGTMSVDSYTQYNQGGIGVSITNGAYAQLVSIFTICDDIGVFTNSGGQCDITNSNCSFGNYGLYSKGVGDSTTKSIYRYTGIVKEEAEADQAIIEVSGIGNLRPYDGQAIYFGELFYEVRSIKILNGGSGYTQAPIVTIDSPTGPNGIKAEASANIDDSGRVTSIDIISSGSQYRLLDKPKITIESPTNPGTIATAELNFYPIYYTIESATLPSAGISTIVLNTNLNNTVEAGTVVYFTRLSLQIATSISLEWVGSGTDINKAKPALGGVTIQDNEVVKEDGGQVVYTSTNQAGNFQIGDGIVINQVTGTVTGRSFNQSILNTVTPLIIALGN
jgi:hypothetical protein